MLSLIVRRLLQLPLILLVILTITLSLAWAVPGNPLENPERRPPPEIAEAMKRQYNLDSFWRFYGTYLYSASGAKYVAESVVGSDAVVAAGTGSSTNSSPGAERSEFTPEPQRYIFDLGPSLKHRDRRINEIIADSLPVSVTLGAAAIVFALVVGVTAGILGAVKPNGLLDLLTLSVALIGISLPSFVIGTVLLLVFSVWLAILPVGEWGTLRSMLLPAVTLGLPPAAYIARLTRLGMIEQLGMDYVRTARAKGLSETQVVLRHALKNAFLPVLSYLGPATAFAMTGSFVVERVFNVPGMGKHFVNGVQSKDLFLIIGVVLVYATMLILLNLLVDVLYRWVDPRIE